MIIQWRMKMAGNALAIRFTTWQFPIFPQKILLKFVKKINNHISNNMNYHAHTMTIINTITIASIAILLTHGTSSKKINAKLALQFSLFFPRITFGPQYRCPWILLHSYPSTRTYSRSIMSCRHVEIIIHIGWSDADSKIPGTGWNVRLFKQTRAIRSRSAVTPILAWRAPRNSSTREIHQ